MKCYGVSVATYTKYDWAEDFKVDISGAKYMGRLITSKVRKLQGYDVRFKPEVMKAPRIVKLRRRTTV